jgi:UDP-N-acetyl-D-mannosaminuronic acid transferase (WecB/TagA/CpsF family)
MLDAFQALVPDGQPVRFALNVRHDAGLRDRVPVDLTLMVCERAARERVKI